MIIMPKPHMPTHNQGFTVRVVTTMRGTMHSNVYKTCRHGLLKII